jgi:DNA-binding SARP family transcriptional activator/transcriptional regulator with XRE-family HTH domain/tetratricopeptide (TPR) repeat protein
MLLADDVECGFEYDPGETDRSLILGMSTSTPPSAPGAPGHGRLRRLRAKAGLSQQELAERAGISVRTLRNLERGGVERPHALSVHRLAAALGVSATELSVLLDLEPAAPPAAPPAADLSGLYGYEPPAAPSRLRIGVLGPLLVHRGVVPVEIGSAMQRTLLGLLAVQPRRTVGAQEIVDVLWEEDPPRTCLQLVHQHVGQLRRLLEPERGAREPGRVLRHVAGGYRLEIDPDQLDLSWSADLAGRARQAWSTAAAESAFQLYREAASYWRGPVLAGTDARLRGHPAVAAVARLRIATLLEWADVALNMARYDEVIGPLQDLCADEPLHEGLAARLMVALAGAGQQAAALGLYAQVRTRLDEQLGVTPGKELATAHLRVLRGQLPSAGKSAVAEADGAPPARPATPVPAQLPTDVAAFTGRAEHLRALDALLPDGDAAADAHVPARIVTIAGMGGVGKTSLAVHWAHRMRERFPDGQLYVNLRGHSSEGPLRPIDALAGFLLAFGVPAANIPPDETQAAAMYRSRLSGRRVLVVLDNAGSAEQVRPLLPAAAGAAVVVTSRDLLTGLIARDGAHLLSLDALAPAESAALLERMLGAARAGAEPEAVTGLARLCAHLPLALRIAAANLAARPRHRIADYVARLATGDRLAALSVDGDADTAVRATFELSCDVLPAAERRMFRLLGLIAVPEVTADSAAALAGVPRDEAERLLDRLTARHLAEEHQPGRYSQHDLLRLYAGGLADAEEGEAGRAAATERFADYYLACTAAAALQLYQRLLHPPKLDLAALAERCAIPLRDAAAALAWLDDERANVIALAVHLAERRMHRAAFELAALFNGYFTRRANPVDWRVLADVGMAAARAGGDPVELAAAELHLGMAKNVRGRFEEAAVHFRRSAELAEQAGWTECRGVAINNLAGMYWTRAQFDETIACLDEALTLHRQAGRREGEAVTLANLAVAHLERQHDLDAASAAASTALAQRLMDQALAVHRSVSDRPNEAFTLRTMAEIARDAGKPDRAVELAERALELARESGDRRTEAGALNTLATAVIARGDIETGLDLHRQVLALVTELADTRLQALYGVDMAASLARAGRPDEGFIELQDALAIGRRMDWPLAIRKIRRALRLMPGRSAAELGLDEEPDRARPASPPFDRQVADDRGTDSLAR